MASKQAEYEYRQAFAGLVDNFRKYAHQRDTFAQFETDAFHNLGKDLCSPLTDLVYKA